MAKLPYFQFYPRDFLSDRKVASMTFAERGAYMTLLCYAWDEDPRGSIPKEDIARLLPGLSQLEICAVLSPFEERDGRYFQPRMVRESAKLAAKSQLLSEAGRRGLMKRWGKESSDSQAIARLLPGNSKSEVRSQNICVGKGAAAPHTQRNRFVPPTLDQTKEHFVAEGMTVGDAEDFFNHHSARGWKLSKGLPMADWHRAAGTWKRNIGKFNGSSDDSKKVRRSPEVRL